MLPNYSRLVSFFWIYETGVSQPLSGRSIWQAHPNVLYATHTSVQLIEYRRLIHMNDGNYVSLQHVVYNNVY